MRRLNPELIILKVHSKVSEEKKELLSILSTVCWGHKVNLPLLPPPPAPVKALLFYLYEEKRLLSKIARVNSAETVPSLPSGAHSPTPPPPQPVFPSVSLGPWALPGLTIHQESTA